MSACPSDLLTLRCSWSPNAFQQLPIFNIPLRVLQVIFRVSWVCLFPVEIYKEQSCLSVILRWIAPQTRVSRSNWRSTTQRRSTQHSYPHSPWMRSWLMLTEVYTSCRYCGEVPSVIHWLDVTFISLCLCDVSGGGFINPTLTDWMNEWLKHESWSCVVYNISMRPTEEKRLSLFKALCLVHNIYKNI